MGKSSWFKIVFWIKLLGLVKSVLFFGKGSGVVDILYFLVWRSIIMGIKYLLVL